MFLLLFSSSLLEEFVTISFTSSLYVCVCVCFCMWMVFALSLSLCLRCVVVAHFFSPIVSRTSSSFYLALALFWLCWFRSSGSSNLFALSLSLFACLLQFVSFFCCLRMSSRFQYEYTFKSCTCFLCYRPKRDDVFAHFIFLPLTTIL